VWLWFCEDEHDDEDGDDDEETATNFNLGFRFTLNMRMKRTIMMITEIIISTGNKMSDDEEDYNDDTLNYKNP